MNFKAKLILIALLLINIPLIAQNAYVLTGNISSEADGSPIPGVSILKLNTTEGVVTDFDGNFSIEVQAGDQLQVSSLGYITQTIAIETQTNLVIVLKEDLNQLDEVVVIGYGTAKKSHLTGSISKVTNEKLDQIAVPRIDDALVGQVSGVNIQQTNGEVGSAPTIRIRGTGSITGDSGPLVVLDGVVVSSDFLGNLDMNDVESFEILKDAASAAIFGSRGANGVIMITSKQGKEGKTRFSYSGFTGINKARQSDDYYFSVAETARQELAFSGELSDKTTYKQLIGVDQDWQDIIFDGGTINSHAISARGGSERTKFSASLNYLHDEGVLLTDDFQRYGMKVNIDTKVTDKFSFGVNLTPTYSNTRRFDGSTHDILRQPPWLPLYLDENTIQFVNREARGGIYADAQIGDYAVQYMFDDYDLETGMPVPSGGTDISNTSNTNPGAKVLERERRDKKFKLFGSVYAKYDFSDKFSFRTALSGDYQDTRRTRYQGTLSSRNGASATQSDYSNTGSIHLVTDNLFSYNDSFGDHEVSAIAGISAEKTNVNYASLTGTGYDFDFVKTINAASNIAGGTSYEYENTLLSYYARGSYAYRDKYLASASYRLDGSSVFGSDNKYGDFYALSLGWNLAKEDFLSSSPVISNLKLRFSYGTTGNNALDTGSDLIDNYPSVALLSATTAIINGGAATGFNPINIANPNLKWERSNEINPGIDFGFINNRISGSLDLYKRTSDQLLLYNPISGTTGFSNALVNLGEVENKGFEFELRTKNIMKEKFSWTSTVIVSKNENTLTDFGDANGQIQNVDDKRASEWINLVGNPISSFYGWVVDKEIPLEYIKTPFHPVGGQAQDVYVKDLNGDGLIDDDDKTILGNPYPELVWSFTNNFALGNFDLSIMFQGSHGAEVRNMADQYMFNHFNSGQDFNPAITPDQGFIKEKIFTNSIIQDASYVTMRTINLGYNFDEGLLSKTGINRLRVYVTGQNLMYFTADGYTGWNPESISDTSPTTYGYQLGGNPIKQTISLGLNLDF